MATTATMYTLQDTFKTPAPISALTFGHASHIFAGSDDGSLRVYDLTTKKVVKAIRNLGGEVSSIVCMKRAGSELRDAWVAHGRTISKFKLDSPKMILSPEDALGSITVGATEDDLINELALNGNKDHLAFGLDSGIVGVIDLTTVTIAKLHQTHDNICNVVSFLPDRPKDLVSAGYDMSIKHIDWTKDELVSAVKMDATIAEGGISLSPPFVLSLALSPSGVLAAGTADGRLGVFFGGEKRSAGQKKPKKWNGLNTAEMLLMKVAEGPIVSMAFTQPRVLTISTMLGVITQFELVYDPQADDGQALLKVLWQGNVSASLEKVNRILVDEKRIVIGGLTKDAKGIFEIWKKQDAVVEAKKAEEGSN